MQKEEYVVAPSHMAGFHDSDEDLRPTPAMEVSDVGDEFKKAKVSAS